MREHYVSVLVVCVYMCIYVYKGVIGESVFEHVRIIANTCVPNCSECVCECV